MPWKRAPGSKGDDTSIKSLQDILGISWGESFATLVFVTILLEYGGGPSPSTSLGACWLYCLPLFCLEAWNWQGGRLCEAVEETMTVGRAGVPSVIVGCVTSLEKESVYIFLLLLVM